MELCVVRELKLGSKERNGDAEEEVVALQQIVKLERRIFPKHESLAETLQQEIRKKNSGLLYALAPHHHHQGGGREAEVAGYIIYTFTSSLAASIVKLAVKECYRRQGYGQVLLEAAISKCQTRPIYRITLHVDPKREAAMALYQKMGFRTDTVVIDYYAPHRDAHRMFLDFDSSL